MENKENVSVSRSSLNRDIDENRLKITVEGDKIVSISGSPRELIGCKRSSITGGCFVTYCDECFLNLCLDGFCILDCSSESIEPIYKEDSDE